MTNHI